MNIHYFQRYDQRENWLTNSTLLLLSRLYHFDKNKFEVVLNTLFSNDQISLSIGVLFGQQEKGPSSTPDGFISQSSFQIIVENKLYDNFSEDQLNNHIEAFDESAKIKILLALSINKVSSEFKKNVMKIIKRKNKKVLFSSITYEELITTIKGQLSEYDIEMNDIIDDYTNLCYENEVIDLSGSYMLAVTTGTSLAENLKYDLYYDPVDRNHNTKFQYLALYNDKTICAIGKLIKVVFCDLKNNKLVSSNDEPLNLTDDEYKRINDVIKNTDYYDLTSENKFYLVDKFNETEYVKSSFSSLRGKKYFFLQDIEGFNKGMSSKELALLLNGKEWE